MVAQLVEDLVHLERRRQRLDQDGRLERSMRHAKLALRVGEDVVPEPGLEMALELGQVEGRRRALRHLGLGAVEDVKAEVEQRAGHRVAVDDHMALGQMPSARPHHQHGGLILERVGLTAGRVGEVDFSGPPVLQVGLAFDHVGEDGRGRILEIGHEDLSAGIERIDDHLAIDRAGDLDPAVEKVGRDLGDGPVAVADGFRLGEKIGQAPGVV